MRLLEALASMEGGEELGALAARFGVDERTLRRDIDALQELLSAVQGVDIQRGRASARKREYAPGYFSDHLPHQVAEKEAIARLVVEPLADDTALAITAGSTTYFVAREIRRSVVESERPRNLIAFTNSLPALLELIAGGVSTGVLGEVYNADDCAFHSHEFRSAFQPGVAIVGASGLVIDPVAGCLELYSHRAEEAAFLKSLLAPIPEIVVAADAAKVNRRHPWSFTSGGVLAGKSIRLVTSTLTEAQRALLDSLAGAARRTGSTFCYQEAAPVMAPGAELQRG